MGEGGYKKNDVTEMLHLPTFQSINNALYFCNRGGGMEKKLFKGGYKK